MNGTRYQASRIDADRRYQTIDFDDAQSAAAECDQHGNGIVVRFRAEPNLHGGTDWKSSGLWVLDGGVWREHALFDGSGRPFREARPE